MKKLVCLLLLVAMIATLFVGCGSFECDICGKESDGEKHEQTFDGETIVFCDKCFEEYKEAIDVLT